MVLKESRGRFSYLHSERGKFITGRSLGSLYDTTAVLKQISEKETEFNPKEKAENCQHTVSTPQQDPAHETGNPEDTFENAKKLFKKFYGKTSDKNETSLSTQDSVSILFFRSELRLVVDLQDCIKAQQSRAYERKVKVSNLKQMAETLIHIQERGYGTREDLENELSGTKAKTVIS